MACLLLFSAGAFAQHDNHWYFGFRAGLDFSSGTPVPVLEGQLNSTEATGSISDAEGNLLFYTNGLTVWNKDHQVMDNGEGLLGDTSTSQSGLIVPKPGAAGHYYIFTGAQFTESDGINYSEVDMQANDGLGKVTLKNIPLLTPACEKLAAVYHSNGTDIWVMAHHWGTANFHAYLVTEDGVAPAPVTSTEGSVLSGDFVRSAGCLKFSPDGSKLAVANNEVSVELFDFDASTGIVSNVQELLGTETSYGIEFSPSGNALYLAQWGKVSQFDLEAADIAASQTTLLELPEGAAGTLQIGPDGKIYLSHWEKPQLTVIHNPDVIGEGCNLDALSLGLGGRLSWWGLPVYITSPFYVTDVNASAQGCFGSEVAFAIESTIDAETAAWDFGDGNTGTGLSVTHTYAASGTYTVVVTATTGFFTRYYTEEITVTLIEGPVANAPGHLQLCDEGNDGVEEFTLTVQDAVVLGGQSTSDFTVTYHNSLTDAEAGINVLPDVYANASNLETIYARVTANATGCHAVTAFLLKLSETPVIDMEDEYTLCQGGTVALAAPEGFDGYLWSTGEITRIITVDEAGTYTVTVTSDNDGLLCESAKDIFVEEYVIPMPGLEQEYISCRGFGISIEAPQGYDSYAWSTGETSRIIHVMDGGNYTLTVTKNGCEATEEFRIREILCGFDVPRGISPNGDGKNDALDLAGLDVTRLDIFNRYGVKVYSRDAYTDEWHGQDDRGHELPDGTYFFSASAEKRADETGWIYISREY